MQQTHHETLVDVNGAPCRFETDWRNYGPTVTGIVSVNQQSWILQDYLDMYRKTLVNQLGVHDNVRADRMAVEALLPSEMIDVTRTDIDEDLDVIVWFGRNLLWTTQETLDYVLEAK